MHSSSQQTLTIANSRIHVTFHAIEDDVRQHLSSRYWRWLELFDQDPKARITQHPDYVIAETPSASQIVLCEATIGDQLVGLGVLVPKSMTLRQAGGFGDRTVLSGYRLAGNRFIGQCDNNLLRSLLFGCEDFCRQNHALFLLIEDLEQTDPLFDEVKFLTSSLSRLFSPSDWQERLTIEFPPTAADYWNKFSSKTRNTFRRKQKKIGTSRLVRISQPEQVAEFLEAAHAISQRTWQSLKLGLRVRNDETEMRTLTFLATHQALRSYLLFVDDKPAAFLIGTMFRGHFAYEEVGYDREFADRSPGQVLLLHVLDDLLNDSPPRVFDFGGGEADYKRLFATTSKTSGTVLIVPPGIRPTFWLMLLRTCRFANRTARSLAGKLGLTTKLRQLIRGKRATFDTPNSTVVTSQPATSSSGNVYADEDPNQRREVAP